MLNVSDLSLSFGKRFLFKDVNLKFAPGNCYGLIGANGAGKSTFLKILSGDVEQNQGTVSIGSKQRIAVLKQDHYAFDDFKVLNTVIMGHEKLYKIMAERDEIYSKEDFTDEDGIRASELEEALDDMNGYEAESDAASLLSGLGLTEDLHEKNMKELEGGEKVRVLLAQALFGDPDILLLDEPTNHLDLESITWLENFLYRFENTVIVVSHDRHFLNKVCTHIADIDFAQIRLYVGNYDFWFEASQLVMKQKKDDNRKKEDKAKELRAFIDRFGSNASKAKQATSRKKLLDKIDIEDIPASTRKFPYVEFKPGRECGKTILSVENLSKKIDGVQVLKDVSFVVSGKDKIAFLGQNTMSKTTLFQILSGEIEPDSGEFRWGETITQSYFPKENSSYFSAEFNLIDWLRQYSEDKDEKFIRSFLGRMLFTGEEVYKTTDVLSGGEKVRCMLSRMMLSNGNVLMLDEPTNHLDLEAITSLNNALGKFPEVMLFGSHDHQLIQTISNRIIEFTPEGMIDRRMDFDDYLVNKDVQKLRDEQYHGHDRMML